MTLAEELLDSTVETLRRARKSTRKIGTSTRCRAAVAEIFGIDAAELDGIDARRPERRRRSATRSGRRSCRSTRRKEALIPTEILRRVERDIMLQIVDAQWKDHLYSLDHLKEGIGLRGYGQRDPLVEYKKESFALFQAMKDRIEEEIVRYLWRLTPVIGDDDADAAPVRQPAAAPAAADDDERAAGAAAVAVRRDRRQRQRPSAVAEPPRPARTGGDDVDQAGEARRAEGRTQRSVPVRQREEVQEVPWSLNRCARVPGAETGNTIEGSRLFAAFCF